MIDGVPQSTTRNTSRDLATIDPSMIERVEVIRGATAIYGDGATGGIVNIVTRTAGAPGVRFHSGIQLGSSVREPGDGLTSRPCSIASRAVINEPLRSEASTTSTPRLSPLMMRLR